MELLSRWNRKTKKKKFGSSYMRSGSGARLARDDIGTTTGVHDEEVDTGDWQ